MKLTGWQRLWLVGLAPWVLLNLLLITVYDDDAMFGYWGLIIDLGEPIERLSAALALLVYLPFLFLAFLVPYTVLWLAAELSWRGVLWVRADFRERDQPRD